jgi:hypothetical protein
MTTKQWIVRSLENWCDRLHFITHHRPWLWVFRDHCPLASLSFRLDEKWDTGVWSDPKEDHGTDG